MNKAIGVLLVISAFVAGIAQAISIQSSVKDGDRLSGVVEIRVTVESQSTVNQVEFYVNGELRGTDASTPYTIRLDTVLEKEGPLSIEVGVYTASGDSKRFKISAVVDNGVSKGAEFHYQNALKFLQVSKWEEAIQACRIALKADETHYGARLAMARSYLGMDVYDEAQKWAEDAYLTKETPEAAELLSAVHVDRAFGIVSRSGERGEAMKEIASAFKASIAQKVAAIDLRIKALGPVTDANRLQHADLLIQKNDYSAARRLLKEKYNQYEPDLALANRLIYAAMRSGRMSEAWEVSLAVSKYGAPDAVTSALMAAGHAYYRRFDDAANQLKEGVFSDPDSPTLMTASAFVALRKGDRGAVQSQLASMLQKSVTSPAVYYYLAILQFSLGQYMESRDNLRNAIVQNPLLYDCYVQRGYEALTLAESAVGDLAKDKPVLLDQAKEFMEVALAAKPDSAEALNGLALVMLNLGKYDEAVRYADAASKAGPEYPWAFYTLSCALDRVRKTVEAQNAMNMAAKLDRDFLEGRGIPILKEAWTYTARNARLPALSL